MLHSETQDGYPICIPSTFHSYNVIQYLGCGSTCIVVLVEDINTHERFSAKIIPKKDIINRNLLKSTMNEINVLKSINHPHIIKVREAFELKNDKEEEFIIIIMEYCVNGDLLSYATNHGFKNEAERKKIIIGFLEAIRYLHNKNISHGDIKSENVLLDKYMSPKLCDFGFCRTTLIAGDESKNGTLYYASPELFRKGRFNTLKSDIWAIGITLYSLAELQFPFKDGDQNYIIKQILSGKLSIRAGLDLKLKKLIEECTTVNPELRPTIDDILHHEYFVNRSDVHINKYRNFMKQKTWFNTSFDNLNKIDSSI
ncbi:hypothetical protein M9Y10_016872 [Tritrichomonas musculus]|uniref:Protein kinase domain-containing protein n=1 Tax=Tritrichomonas musculus TaxID=1915356 RepID=A0ABR2HXQ5_9EUKA